jgi:type 1 fimbria pilin
MRNFYKRAATLAVIALSAQATFAQGADGTVSFTGQVTSNTCTLQMSEGTTVSNGGTLTVDFGKVSLPTGTVTAAMALGTEKTVSFLAVKDSSGGGVCPASTGSGDKAAFNVLLGLTADQITTVSTKTYRKNDTTGGTNAVLKLSTGGGAQLTLTAMSNYTGTFVGTAALPISTTSANASMQLKAQLVTSAASVPSSGIFTASIPLFLVYQ